MARRRRRKSDEAPGWVWMTFGLGIGLVIALGVYLNGPRIFGAAAQPAGTRATAQENAVPLPPLPTQAPAVADAANAAASATAATANSDATSTDVADAIADAAGTTDTAAPGSSAPPPRGDDAEDPNRFSFYDLLPSFEVVIPEVETPAATPRAPVAAIETPGVYILQAGSFLTEADAEAQRARLGLLGIESRVQRVSIDDRTFHRVRIGPIEDLDELDGVRNRLRSADVDSMIMRVDP